MPVTLSPFASLRVNSAKGLARRAERSFASLRACPERSEGMTARTLSSPLPGSLISKHLLQFCQFIPYIGHSQDIAWMTGIGLDFAAQAADINPDEINLAVILGSPYSFQQ